MLEYSLRQTSSLLLSLLVPEFRGRFSWQVQLNWSAIRSRTILVRRPFESANLVVWLPLSYPCHGHVLWIETSDWSSIFIGERQAETAPLVPGSRSIFTALNGFPAQKSGVVFLLDRRLLVRAGPCRGRTANLASPALPCASVGLPYAVHAHGWARRCNQLQGEGRHTR